MRKMRLELDALEVESFSTAVAMASRGTVQGNSDSEFDSCYDTCGDICQSGGDASHQITCGDACGGVTNHASCDNSGYKHCG